MFSGGTASDTTINGGFMEVESGAVTNGTTGSFTMAGGVLQFDASQSFEGLIAGFASPHAVTEEIDLVDIPFSSGQMTETFAEAANHLSGTLTMSNSASGTEPNLTGQYSRPADRRTLARHLVLDLMHLEAFRQRMLQSAACSNVSERGSGRTAPGAGEWV